MTRRAIDRPRDPVDLFEPPDLLPPTPEALDNGFPAILDRMTPAERISASRHGGFTRHERVIWAARYPDEVPLVNGEFEWIAAASADLD